MAENWQAVAAEVSQALAEVGFEAVLRRFVPGSGKPWEASTATTTDIDVTVMSDEFGWGMQAGTAIEAQDRRFVVAVQGLDNAPTPADKLVIGSDVYQVVNVKPLEPGGVALLYDLQVRK